MHQEWIVEMVEGRPEEQAGTFVRGYPPLQEDPSNR
jgi:hypothetical protein